MSNPPEDSRQDRNHPVFSVRPERAETIDENRAGGIQSILNKDWVESNRKDENF
jgi:hypothetical protein